MEKTSTGLEENVAGLLCYIASWVSGIVFLVIEKENKFVRFHATQSIIFTGAITIILIILAILATIPFIGFLFLILFYIILLLAIALIIVLMVKAYQGTMFKLPVSGDMAEKWTGQSAK